MATRACRSTPASPAPKLTVVSVYADLIRYRELFGSLFRRDLRARYKGTVFGVAWSLANPLLLMAIYVLVFSLLWKVTSIDRYPLFLLCGLSVWIFVSSSLTGAARSMLDYAELIKKVRFPRQLVAFSVVATQLVPFAAMLAGLIVVDAIVLERTRDTVLLSIPVAAGIVVLAAGMSLAIASANVVLRDVEHLLAALLLPWFFLTPILYSLEELPGGFGDYDTVVDVLRWVNPLTPPIYALRDPLFYGEVPAAGDVIYLAVAAFVSLAVGALVFSRVDDRIAVEL
jgi:lipopolysaccharide transport system permease protein